ncbi:DUF3375 family protein [Microbacterium sp. 22195]|uniref:DUF3375 family protein n=1 Tax=Microbacterium sp. 22195 TaxID=3453891 RepID=UPI003F8280A6
MSEVSGEFVRALSAFKQPTLSLLSQRHAPVIVAILGSCFSREVRQIPAARLHVNVQDMLAEVAGSGLATTAVAGADAAEAPTGTGREVCLRWMAKQWLIRSTTADGDDVYSLTSHAQQALDFITTIRQERTGLSEHRIANIVATARRINRESNPDAQSRIAILDAEITQLTVERDRLMAGGEVTPMSEDRLVEGFDELLSLVAQLPSDFKRVEEAFRSVRAEILDDFRAERRVPGEVIDRYLQRIDTLITATPEGRAFDGAFALLRNDDLLSQLRSDITTLIDHGEDLLIDRDRDDLRGIVPLMRKGLDSVLEQRSRITDVLRTYITTHDASKDRELDRVLRSLEQATAAWLAVAGPNEKVDVVVLPGHLDITHLKERYFDPSDEAALPDLHDSDCDERPEGLSLEKLRTYGGPRMAELDAALAEMRIPLEGWSLGQLFADLPDELRRPVDALGLLHLAINREGLVRAAETEQYTTIRPDGSTRRFDVPVLAPGRAAEEEPL